MNGYNTIDIYFCWRVFRSARRITNLAALCAYAQSFENKQEKQSCVGSSVQSP